MRKCCETPRGADVPHLPECSQQSPPAEQAEIPLAEPDWNSSCDNCGAKPVVPETGMCGPCTFGEAETIDGNW